MTLQINKLELIQHAQSIKVKFTHPDLPRAFAELILPLPMGAEGSLLTGDALDAALAEQAPPRDWFERQEQRLAGEAAFVVSMPPELQALAPIKALGRALEWYEDARVGEPTIVDGQWVKPVLPVDLRDDTNLADLKRRLISKLADVRFHHETGGVEIAGALVKTDRESQATITGAYTRAKNDPTATVQWKADNGFVTLDAAAIIVFGNAVFDHVQGCFAREKHLSDQIDLCSSVSTLLALAEEINEGWEA